MLGWLFGDRRGREARQLNADAPVIIDQSRQMFSPPRQAELAARTGDELKRARETYGTADIDLKRALYDLRKLHRDARFRNDQLALSVFTLVIIRLKADLAGERAEPARRAIDAFVSEAPADDETSA